MFFTIHYTLPPTRQNHTGLILSDNKEKAIEKLMKKHPKAKVKKVIY